MGENSICGNKTSLYRSLFRGREDVFAIRWEKGKKAGYMPAYRFDPYMFRLHKRNGGTFNNYKDKSLLPLSDGEVKRHLLGEQFIGIYPLLHDNTSWFIAADFDKDNWQEEAVAFLNICQEYDLYAYLERSRSGNGGHVWFFFESPYPATKSRRLAKKLLELSGAVSVLDRQSSFDRLFPNQDYLSGKGLGNLIALPLNGLAVSQGNTCFLEITTFEPYDDQWGFLGGVHKNTIEGLDSILEKLVAKPKAQTSITNTLSGKVSIKLSASIEISKDYLPKLLIDFLKEELNVFNTEYAVKKRSGRSTWDTERFFKLYEESDEYFQLPKGLIGKLLRYCRKHDIEYTFEDKRQLLPSIGLSFQADLRPYQSRALQGVMKKDIGIIVAPPAFGKTVLGLKLIAERQQPALIIVHRKLLLDQWKERIIAFLGIPKRDIGVIGQEKVKIGKQVTIAMIQSLANQMEGGAYDQIHNAFGTVLIDECHHIPAKTFRSAIARLNTYYQYGLTATPMRKHSDEKLLNAYLGDIIVEVKPEAMEGYKAPSVVIRDTQFKAPFNPKTDNFELLSNILIHDSGRNRLIINDIVKMASAGRKALVITERKEHIKVLYMYLSKQFEVIALSGDNSSKERKAKIDLLSKGAFQIAIVTGQLFGEGLDISSIDCLFLAYPFSFQGKLIQYIGRVQRSNRTPAIYDYRDREIPYLNRMFLQRNKHYRQVSSQISLFDDHATLNIEQQPIEKTIAVPIEELEFSYGAISFDYTIKSEKLVFDIPNDNMRPEFDILKPYFAKYFGRPTVSVKLYIELENGQVMAMEAQSEMLEQINQEIVDSVKFRFVQEEWIKGKGVPPSQVLTGLDNTEKKAIFSSEEELLDNLLADANYKHSKQLRHLAQRHEAKLMKVRFVLQPFSFVFVLAGSKMFHVVMETLDTEEATYLWHINKGSSWVAEIHAIEKHLELIRHQGRQVFLTNPPENFSRVLHDYTDEKSGFYKWKAALEERLY